MEPNGKAQPAGNYAWGLTATFGYVKNGEEVSLDSSSMLAERQNSKFD